MSDRATSISPGVLAWARERAGMTVEEAAGRAGVRAEVLGAWESGTAWPTYNQLENLADNAYRRPVALFFLPQPPDEPTPQQEFRTLPEFDIDALSADTRMAVREGLAYQESLRELTGAVNPAIRKVLGDMRVRLTDDVAATAERLRDYLGVSLDEQKSWRRSDYAMANWRSRVEDAGVFVFKRPFKQREISGFCLADPVFPIIMINNGTPFTRQTFTLFHELAHLLQGVSSVTTLDGGFVGRMSGTPKSIEVWCNELAAEYLVPAAEFPWSVIDPGRIEDSVTEVANDFCVSREVILRRVLDRGWIDTGMYIDLVRGWADEGGGDRSGGNYYNNQVAYLGLGFLRLAFSRYRAGLISAPELAEHLGVKARNISRLEHTVSGRL